MFSYDKRYRFFFIRLIKIEIDFIFYLFCFCWFGYLYFYKVGKVCSTRFFFWWFCEYRVFLLLYREKLYKFIKFGSFLV